jgi:3D (Asp-Asp-Asp) domain-containing protein
MRKVIKTRKLNGQFANKAKLFWGQFKDFLLVLMLLNTLIGMLKNFDKADISGGVRESNRVEVSAIQVAEENRPTRVDDTPADILQAEFSAYTIGDGFTPDTIMASGNEVYRGAIACPIKYKFGTRIKVGEDIYTCEDRMAERFRNGEYFDIYFSDLDEAIKFGRKQLDYSVIN